MTRVNMLFAVKPLLPNTRQATPAPRFSGVADHNDDEDLQGLPHVNTNAPEVIGYLRRTGIKTLLDTHLPFADVLQLFARHHDKLDGQYTQINLQIGDTITPYRGASYETYLMRTHKLSQAAAQKTLKVFEKMGLLKASNAYPGIIQTPSYRLTAEAFEILGYLNGPGYNLGGNSFIQSPPSPFGGFTMTFGPGFSQTSEGYIGGSPQAQTPPVQTRALIPYKGPKTAGGYEQADPRLAEFAQFTVDLTHQAALGEFDPVIGREDSIKEIQRVLKHRNKHNAALIGDSGVGKTAIVQGLAQALAQGKADPKIKGSRIWQVDLNSIVAGTMYRGQMEEKLDKLLKFAQTQKDIILFIDEAHTLNEAGGSSGSGSIGTALRPYLSSRKSRMILSMTEDEYLKHFTKDPSMDRRFRPVFVNPPSKATTIEILKGLKGDFEKDHNVDMPDDVLPYLVGLTARYLPTRNHPAKDIDVMDSASVLAAERGLPAVTRQIVAEVVSQDSKIPVQLDDESEEQNLQKLEEILSRRVIGHADAKVQIADAIRRRRTGISNQKGPIGKFFLTGPTGVGKTELAKALSEYLSGSADNIIRVDMGEYGEKHSVARLIGAPPGYVGYEGGGQLTEALRKRPYSVILLDEIEKAHPDVYTALLPLLDEGRITDGNGRTVDASNTIIIATSNAGSRAVQQVMENGGFGFHAQTDKGKAELARQLQQEAIDDLLPPELQNRFDDILFLQNLSKDEQVQVVNLHLDKWVAYLASEKNIHLSVDDDVKKLLAAKLFPDKDDKAKAGHTRKNGRNALNVITQTLQTPLAKFSLESGLLRTGGAVKASVDKTGKQVLFEKQTALARIA